MSENVENAEVIKEQSYEFNSFYQIYENVLSSCGVGLYDYFSKEEIANILQDPIGNYDLAIRLSEFVYTKSGIVSNSIDYQTSLMTLDKIITSLGKYKSKKKFQKNKEIMDKTLKLIDDKAFIRDALFTQMLDGIAFYYFETKTKPKDMTKYLNDYDVESIVEINDSEINANIITLPWQYCKIVGRKNNRYIVAFNLDYFRQFQANDLERKLKQLPLEIVKAYKNNDRSGNWIVLDSDHTMCRKIKCKNSEPWGRSLIISALADVLYKDYFTDAKHSVLDSIVNKIIYQVFPENKQGNGCTLTRSQQENQHSVVKQAVMNKTNKGGTNFLSLAAGTKIGTIDTSVDIFDEKNESNLNNDIATDLGVSASLIGAMSTGNYAAGTHNVEMITSQLYTWICEWKEDLVYVINKNIIKDKENAVDIYYFPTSFVNRKEFFEMMRSLYVEGSGSLTYWIASAGVSPEVYLSVLDHEIDEDFENKYPVHGTSYTQSSKDNKDNNDSNKGETVAQNKIKDKGRPSGENSIANKGGNTLPSPSDNK